MNNPGKRIGLTRVLEEGVWKNSFFRKGSLPRWHPSISPRIDFFTYNFQGFWLNEHLPRLLLLLVQNVWKVPAKEFFSIVSGWSQKPHKIIQKAT